MFCPKCGTQNDDNSAFCQGCGTPLQNIQPVEQPALDASPAAAEVAAKPSQGVSFLKGNFINDAIDRFITAVRDLAWDRYFKKIDSFFGTLGNWGYYLTGIIGLITFIVAGIRFREFFNPAFFILAGFAFVLGSVLFSYTGRKLISSLTNLVVTIPSTFSSSGIVDVLAMIFFVMGILGGVTMIAMESAGLGFILIGVGIVCSFVCIVSTKILGVTFERCSTAEEVLAIITMYFKACVRLTPFVWGIGSVVSMVFAFMGMVGEDPEGLISFIGISCGLGLLPFTMYLSYLLYNFVLDFIRAIVSLPFKLDKIAKNTEKDVEKTAD